MSSPFLLDIGIKVSKEIPSEVLIGDKTVVIGIVSTSLLKASKRISLVHLVNWKNDQTKLSYLNNLDLAQNETPKTLIELSTVIKSFVELD